MVFEWRGWLNVWIKSCCEEEWRRNAWKHGMMGRNEDKKGTNIRKDVLPTIHPSCIVKYWRVCVRFRRRTCGLPRKRHSLKRESCTGTDQSLYTVRGTVVKLDWAEETTSPYVDNLVLHVNTVQDLVALVEWLISHRHELLLKIMHVL